MCTAEKVIRNHGRGRERGRERGRKRGREGYILNIIKSVDSVNRDERGFPLTQYITNGGISRAKNTITHFKHHHFVLQRISNRMGVQHRHNSAVYVRAARSKKSPFGVLLLLFLHLLILHQWTERCLIF